MKVFISWSGETSKAIALLLRKYLPIMLQRVRPFMSMNDIVTGSRWSERIQLELEDSYFGIIVLTPSNLNAKWIMFEAGAISKLKNSSTACLLCAGVSGSEIVGPLQQFQFQKFEKESFFKLILDINQQTDAPIDGESMILILDKWWTDIEREYQECVHKHLEQEQKEPRDEREFQDEILNTLRTLVNRSTDQKFDVAELTTLQYEFPKEKLPIVVALLRLHPEITSNIRFTENGASFEVTGPCNDVKKLAKAIKFQLGT